MLVELSVVTVVTLQVLAVVSVVILQVLAVLSVDPCKCWQD